MVDLIFEDNKGNVLAYVYLKENPPIWHFDDLSDEQWEKRKLYENLLAYANIAKTSPLQSNYHVKEAALLSNGLLVHGGNIEYSLTRAIHGEESLIANALQHGLTKENKIELIAIVVGEPGNVATPCGNCRDLLRQYVDMNVELVCGSPKGGIAKVMPLSAYYFDNYKKLEAESLILDIQKYGVIEYSAHPLRKAIEKAYNIYTTEEDKKKNYGAYFLFDNEIISGKYIGDAAYHPILPLTSAIATFENSGLWKSDIKHVHGLMLGALDNIPDVKYIERQHLQEFAQKNSVLGMKYPLPVYLIKFKKNSEINSNWKIDEIYVTDSKEWLPYSFGPLNLGLEDAIKNYNLK